MHIAHNGDNVQIITVSSNRKLSKKLNQFFKRTFGYILDVSLDINNIPKFGDVIRCAFN